MGLHGILQLYDILQKENYRKEIKSKQMMSGTIGWAEELSLTA